MQRVLLLDNSFYPVDIISWEKAITYVIQNKVDVLDFYDFFISSPNKKHQLPKVIRLHSKHKRTLLKPSSRKIKKRDNNRCAYCGDHFDDKELSVDHIIPKASGKTINTWKNLITACLKCNMKKGGRTPLQASMDLLFIPRTVFSPISYIIKHDEKDVFREWLNLS
jgi:5-methylcytosine-specific restriction endonuclease McrA